MQAGWRAALLILLLVTLGSCGDETTAPKPAELAGTWTATKAEYVSVANTSTRIDIVAGGGAATLVLTADGRYEYVEIPKEQSPDTTRGGWSASADVMTFTVDGMPWATQFDLYFSGNTLRLTGGHSEYDFGQGGGLEEARQNLEFTRPG